MSRWFLGPPKWSDLERVLSDRPGPLPQPEVSVVDLRDGESDRASDSDPDGESGVPERAVPYAELHAHSSFSFLDGASEPEDLVAEAARLGLTALALTDHEGLYGVIRFARAAREHGLDTVYGAELTVGAPPGADLARTGAPIPVPARTGTPDPEGEHLLVLARSLAGYRLLSRELAEAHLRGKEKGRAIHRLEDLTAAARQGEWLVLTGCRKGSVVPVAQERIAAGDPAGAAEAAAARIGRLVDLFGAGSVAVELSRTGDALTDELDDALAQGARLVREDRGLDSALLPLVATGGVHCARPRDKHLVDAMAALRSRRSLDEIDGHLAARPVHLRSGPEMARAFARYPEAVANAAQIGRDCAVDLLLAAPDLPPSPVPAGHDEASWLRAVVARGAEERYGPRGAERVPGAWAQIDHELTVIADLGFPGYFLIVHDLVAFCRGRGILCQGRGSAANSAVCYALGITAVDPVAHGLLFERFLAPERDGPPDIDIDIASDRREEVIQYVYERYGRENAAQVANVISYRSKLAVRDAARALGHDQGLQDAWSRRIERSHGTGPAVADDDSGIPAPVLDLARRLHGAPRHLGIHSGGMVLCDRPVVEVCPVEWARAEGRTVLQWDKDDCADAGLVKFDLLGLGMLTALDHALRLTGAVHGDEYELATLPQEDPAVYDMLCAADSVGIFQVESRAQMSTLPRLAPRTFYDLVVEVALVRPGPIQGGSVHPYIRRANGEEEVTYLHPRLESALGKTYGVPLFQEQLMQMAVDVADFTPSEADQLRRAMGSKRSTAKMIALKERLFAGMAGHGIDAETGELIFTKMLAFANYGFPESHAYSFAYLVYASSLLKCYYPAAFCAALLRSQPMGFYSPQSLVADARRHGVVIRGVDINASPALTTPEVDHAHRPYSLAEVAGTQVRGSVAARGPALRLGLEQVRGLGREVSEAIADERASAGAYASASDLARRVTLSAAQLDALATAGALDGLQSSAPNTAGTAGDADEAGTARRAALWGAGAAAKESPQTVPGVVVGTIAPTLPGMSDAELAAAGAWATGITVDDFPTEHVRPRLTEENVLTSASLRRVAQGTRVEVGGVVTHRQRPMTAGGTTFLGMEDETGLLNVVVSPGTWTRHRDVLRGAPALVVRGIVENANGAVNLVADGVRPLHLPVGSRSRDFR